MLSLPSLAKTLLRHGIEKVPLLTPLLSEAGGQLAAGIDGGPSGQQPQQIKQSPACPMNLLKEGNRWDTVYIYIQFWNVAKQELQGWELVKFTGMILSWRPANERRRYFVTTSLIGWAPTYNQPWIHGMNKGYISIWICHLFRHGIPIIRITRPQDCFDIKMRSNQYRDSPL